MDYQLNDYMNSTSLDYGAPENENEKNIPLLILQIIFPVPITIFNGLVILAISLNPELRNKSKYFLILILSICDFLYGLVLLPISAYLLYFVAAMSNYCNVTLLLVTQVGFIYEISISILLVGAICIDWITKMTVSNYPEKTRYQLAVFMALYICIETVLILGAVMFPNIETSLYPCFLTFKSPYDIIILCLSEIPHILFLLITTLLLIVTFFNTRTSAISDVPSDIIFASIITIICEVPAILIYLLQYFDVVRYIPALYQTSIFCSYARRFILPVLWLVNTYSRKEMIKSLTKIIRCKNSVNMNIEMSENITHETK